MRILILYVFCFGDQLISILRMLISSSAWIPDRKSQQSPVDDQEAQLLHLLNDPMSCQGMGYGILRLYVIFATPLLFTFAVKKPYENPRRRNYIFAKCHSCFDNKGKHPIIIVDGRRIFASVRPFLEDSIDVWKFLRFFRFDRYHQICLVSFAGK